MRIGETVKHNNRDCMVVETKTNVDTEELMYVKLQPGGVFVGSGLKSLMGEVCQAQKR